MSHIKRNTLVGLCALLSTASLPTLVFAQSTGHTTINGGGSTLLGPYWEQIAYCLDSVNTSYYKPGSTSPTFAPQVTKVAIGIPSSTICSPTYNGTYGVGYDATGSGAGQAGFFAHLPVPGTPFSPANSTGVLTSSSTIQFGTTNAAGAATAVVYKDVQYGLSDNSLVDSDIGVYSVGTNTVYTPPHGRAQIMTAAMYQGYTFTPGTTTHAVGTADFPVPMNLFGPAIQIPVSIDPVALAYNSTYKAGYTLQINSANKPAGLHLDGPAYCAILSGQITDWGNSALTKLNGNKSLKDPADTGAAPITLIGRADGSGTTSILTRHLAAICPTADGFGSAGTTKITNLPTSISSHYTLVNGSGGVASSINGTPGAIGYIGTDYTAPYNTASGTNSFNLPSAVLKNAKNFFVAATPAGASAAFGTVLPPQSDSKGNYVATTTTSGYRDDPTAWVQSTSATAPLAKPTATAAYPIVGTTNFLGYTCYATANQEHELVIVLNNVFGTTGNKDLTNVGLANLTTPFKQAIKETFLIGSAATDGSAALNLFFATKGASSANPTCNSVSVGG